MNSLFMVEKQNLLNKWYCSELAESIDLNTFDDEFKLLAWFTTVTTRTAQACVHLQNGNGSEHGHFGDLAIPLLRISVENFANLMYLYFAVKSRGSTEYEQSIHRFLEYSEIQKLKLAKSMYSASVEGLDFGEPDATQQKNIQLLEGLEASFRDKYYKGNKKSKLDPIGATVPRRLEESILNCPAFVSKSLLHFCRAILPELNSRVHSDAYSLEQTLMGDENEQRLRRLQLGDRAQGMSNVINCYCWRIVAHRLGRLEHLLGAERMVEESLVSSGKYTIH